MQAIRRARCFSAGLRALYRVISDWRCVGVIDFEISDALLRFAFGCVVTLPRGLVVADEEAREEGFATALVRVPEGVAVDGDAVDGRSEGVPVVTVGADDVDCADVDGSGWSSEDPPREHDPISIETAKAPTTLLARIVTAALRSD